MAYSKLPNERSIAMNPWISELSITPIEKNDAYNVSGRYKKKSPGTIEVLATASIVISECLALNDITILLLNRKHLGIGYPSRATSKGQANFFCPTNDAFRNYLNEKILGAYLQWRIYGNNVI